MKTALQEDDYEDQTLRTVSHENTLMPFTPCCLHFNLSYQQFNWKSMNPGKRSVS